MKKSNRWTYSIICVFIVGIIWQSDVIVSKALNFLPVNIELRLASEYMPDKFWLHRVDSVEKQEELADKYKGIEFDIVYYENSKAFENSHDKESLDKYNLEKQFITYKKAGRKQGIWLDFKNLSIQNQFEALHNLQYLLSKYDIDKSKVIIESREYKALKVFYEAGFKTSYYFTYKKNVDKKDLHLTKQVTEEVVKQNYIYAISFDGSDYSYIKSLNIPERVQFLSWLDGKRWYEVLLRRKYKDIREDERVKVILVKDLGNYSR